MCWLSFEASEKSVKKCLYLNLLDLKQLETDSANVGRLHKKMYLGYFLGTLYLQHEVLPILSTLIKTFQKGSLSCAHIKGSINFAKDQLNQLLEGEKKVAIINAVSLTTINLTQEDEAGEIIADPCY